MRRSLSLTSRLTLFFTLVTATTVLALACVVLVASERHFTDLDRMTLQDKQQLINAIFDNTHSVEETQARLQESLSHHHGLYAIVKDVNGQTLFSSKGFQLPAFLLAAKPDTLQHWTDQGREFNGLFFQSTPAFVGASTLSTFVAMDTAHHAQFMADLSLTLGLYALAVTLVSGLLSWLAARQGLAPLRSMKAKATSVSAQRLDQRMQVDAVPVEMADLAIELNRMFDRLQTDFQRLSDFSSDLAHELRTPISNLLTQTQVALSAKRDAATYRDILASNAEEFQRLARMVSDMLFLAKTERGVELPQTELFSVASEAQALVEFYDALAAEKGVKISCVGDGDILGDRLMFRRAVSNLLSNAIRHSHDHGEVSIEIVETQQATTLKVENTGDAIDPKALPRLFDRFYREHPARSHQDSDGAGLGLAITRAILEAHGGCATATSSQSKTSFSLTIPRKNGPNKTAVNTRLV
jgi:two-component system heavy metal sensor histidine kinase CusS